MRRFIGLMSGTSCDGVDAALVEIDGLGPALDVRFIRLHQAAYPPDLQRRLLDLMAGATTTPAELARLDRAVGAVFAGAAVDLMAAAGLDAQAVAAIGSHGQTLAHEPDHPQWPATWQIGDAAEIAVRTGVAVVSDFRSNDIAAGGQGAPLVPWTDWVWCRGRGETVYVQNLGGIANVTVVPADAPADAVVAFDCGPGCMVIDELVRILTGGASSVDLDGACAGRGRTDHELVTQLLQGDYFARGLPKSAGREQFGRSYAMDLLSAVRHRGGSNDDAVATATRLTARAIGSGLERYGLLVANGRMLLCGGGARNATLAAMIREELPGVAVDPIDAWGIPTQAKECVSFAMLAAARLDDTPANLPQVTGARRQVVLGQLTRA